MTTLEKAIKIIIANEGNYGSVNRDDNGAVSVGKCQWHAGRAKSLLIAIIKADVTEAKRILTDKLYGEIMDTKISWNKRIVDQLEATILKVLLSSKAGVEVQNRQSSKDVQSYITHILKYDIVNENAIIFLADIENQGGSSASKRIITNTQAKHGKYATFEDYVQEALEDRVFKKYQTRRLKVYKELTGVSYRDKSFDKGIVYEVKRGDTLYAISRRYSTTIEKIVKDNNIKNPALIYIGQELKIIK